MADLLIVREVIEPPRLSYKLALLNMSAVMCVCTVRIGSLSNQTVFFISFFFVVVVLLLCVCTVVVCALAGFWDETAFSYIILFPRMK